MKDLASTKARLYFDKEISDYRLKVPVKISVDTKTNEATVEQEATITGSFTHCHLAYLDWFNTVIHNGKFKFTVSPAGRKILLWCHDV